MDMMGMLILLTAEAAEKSGGFGLNFNILETNLINLAIVIGVVVYFGKNLLGKQLAERQSQIAAAITEAEQRKQTAAAALAEQQQKLAQAQAEANKIKAEAETRAKVVREEVLAQAKLDVERMQATAAQELGTQQDRVVRELRQRVVALALEKAEAQLNSGMINDRQQEIIDRSISMLGGGQ